MLLGDGLCPSGRGRSSWLLGEGSRREEVRLVQARSRSWVRNAVQDRRRTPSCQSVLKLPRRGTGFSRLEVRVQGSLGSPSPGPGGIQRRRPPTADVTGDAGGTSGGRPGPGTLEGLLPIGPVRHRQRARVARTHTWRPAGLASPGGHGGREGTLRSSRRSRSFFRSGTLPVRTGAAGRTADGLITG